jgi:hypothetical protein
MSTLTIRIPEGMSINRMMDELATSVLTQYGTGTRFKALAQRGASRRGLTLLDKLDRAFAKGR